jgi:hypothetical protein
MTQDDTRVPAERLAAFIARAFIAAGLPAAGEQSHAKLPDRRAHGVPMPKSLRESLNAVARDLNAAPLEQRHE